MSFISRPIEAHDRSGELALNTIETHPVIERKETCV